MATYNYIKAVWRNGAHVVSDAPEWVVETIERVVPVWLFAHDRTFVGVQFDISSRLMLGVFVSPGAFETEDLLEDARDGSFIHVFATDHPESVALGKEQARVRFEHVYGPALSDAALRQERSYALLEFPLHRDLAADRFVPKDVVEGGMGLPGGFATRSAREREPDPLAAVPSTIADDADPSFSRELLRSGSSRARSVPSEHVMDQGLSYQEVLERLSGSEGDAAPRRSDVERHPSSASGLLGRARDATSARDRAPRFDPAPGRVERDRAKNAAAGLLGTRSLDRPGDADPESLFELGLTYQELVERLAPRSEWQPTADVETEEVAREAPPTTEVSPPVARASTGSSLLSRSGAGFESESILDQGLSYAELIERFSQRARQDGVERERPPAEPPAEPQPLRHVRRTEVVRSDALNPPSVEEPEALVTPDVVSKPSPRESKIGRLSLAAVVFSISAVAGVLLAPNVAPWFDRLGAPEVVASLEPPSQTLPLQAPATRETVPPVATAAAPIAPPLETAPEASIREEETIAVVEPIEVTEPQVEITRAVPSGAGDVSDAEPVAEPPAVVAAVAPPASVSPVQESERAEPAAVEPVATAPRKAVAAAPSPVVSNALEAEAQQGEPTTDWMAEPSVAEDEAVVVADESEFVPLPPVSAAARDDESAPPAEATAPEDAEVPEPAPRRTLKRRKLMGQMQRAR